jgi:hypothetical protein
MKFHGLNKIHMINAVFPYNEHTENENEPVSFPNNTWSLPRSVATFDTASALVFLSNERNKWVNNLPYKKSRAYTTGKKIHGLLLCAEENPQSSHLQERIHGAVGIVTIDVPRYTVTEIDSRSSVRSDTRGGHTDIYQSSTQTVNPNNISPKTP